MGALFKASGFRSAVVCAAFLLLGSLGQGQSRDEVRARAGPYRPPPQVLRAESRLVYVDVVVRDSRGRAIGGFAKDDFVVLDAGRPVEILAFSASAPSGGPTAPASTSATSASPAAQTNPPSAMQPAPGGDRWIGLFFDDINTLPGDLGRAKIAAKRFIREATESGDRIGVFTASGGQVLPFTSDTAAVIGSLAAVQSHPRVSPAGLKACPRITPYEAYLIVKNDPSTTQAKVSEACACGGQDDYAGCDPNFIPKTVNPTDILDVPQDLRTLLASVVEQAQATWDEARLATEATLDAVSGAIRTLAAAPGKRMLLFASSGFLTGDLGPKEQGIIGEAVRAGVVIDSLDAKGLYAELPGRPLSEPSHTLSSVTMVYEAQSLADQLENEDSAMAGFAESSGGLLFRDNNDLDYGFRELGLAPAYAYVLGFQPAEDGKYHKIRVELRSGKHYFMQARPGYFAPTGAPSVAPTPAERIDAAVLGSEEMNGIPLAVSETAGAAAEGKRNLSVKAHVGIEKLPFEVKEGIHGELLTLVAALFDANDKFVTGEEGQIELALKPESFERFSKSGIGATLSLVAPPGRYRLRVVVEEGVKGQMSATTRSVEMN